MTRNPIYSASGALFLCALLSVVPASAEQNEPGRAWGDPKITNAGAKAVNPAAEAPKASPADAAKPAPANPTTKTPEKSVEASPSKAPAALAPAQVAAPPANVVPPAAAPLETGAISPPPARQATASGDWVLECGPDAAKSACTLRQLVADGKKRRIIEMRATSVGKTAFLEVIVPTGISIPYGVTVDVATDKKLPAQLVDCGVTGCRAVLLLDVENVKAINAATTLAVTFQDSKSGKVISISGSPKGFEPGITKVIGAS
jgi:invasion protein IalB